MLPNLEVEAVEMFARVTGDSSILEPPDEDLVQEHAKIESAVLSGDVFRRAFSDEANSQMSAGPDAADPAAANSQMSVGGSPCSCSCSPSSPCLSSASSSSSSSCSCSCSCSPSCPSPSPSPDDSAKLCPGAGETTLRFTVREDQYWFWRTLEAQYARTGLPWRFVSFLCLAV